MKKTVFLIQALVKGTTKRKKTTLFQRIQILYIHSLWQKERRFLLQNPSLWRTQRICLKLKRL